MNSPAILTSTFSHYNLSQKKNLYPFVHYVCFCKKHNVSEWINVCKYTRVTRQRKELVPSLHSPAPASHMGSTSNLAFLLCFLTLEALVGASAVVVGLRRHDDGTRRRRRPQPGFGGGADETVCDLFSGSWVKDDTYPLYQSQNCPIIDSQFNCQLYGRPDSDYLRYRWKPAGCDLPRSVFSWLTRF